MQRHISKSDRGLPGTLAGRFGAILALTGLLLLSACGSSDSVRDNDLPEPSKDGVPPVLTTVTMQPNGIVEPGQNVRIDFTASGANLQLRIPDGANGALLLDFARRG